MSESRKPIPKIKKTSGLPKGSNKRPRLGVSFTPPDFFDRVDAAFNELHNDLKWNEKSEGVKPNTKPMIRDPFNQNIEVDVATKPKKRTRRAKTDPARVSRLKGESPVTAFVRSLNEKEGTTYYTAKQVAQALDVAPSTVRHYARKGVTQSPSHYANFGEIEVSLFTEKD